MSENIKLSDQAMGSIMMALQKCLLEQTDITEILRSFDFVVDGENFLLVKNPPSFEFDVEKLKEEEDV